MHPPHASWTCSITTAKLVEKHLVHQYKPCWQNLGNVASAMTMRILLVGMPFLMSSFVRVLICWIHADEIA